MKIDISKIDQTQFMTHPHVWNNETLWLIQPVHIGAKWNQTNKHFRSSLWNEDGELVSAGFAKFTNWGENPEHFPPPENLSDCVFTEKLDGSLLIVSKYKGKFILRTRGTVDASKLDNGYEIELFKTDILPKLLDVHLVYGVTDTWKYSFLFEWTSPENRIVVRYGDSPTWSLVGIVYHGDYSLIDQLTLDNLAWQHGLNRPTVYKFTTIAEFLDLVAKWEGKEGVVCYSKNGQMLHKVKSDWYLALHRMKEEFGNIEKIVDFYMVENCPSYTEFLNKIALLVDWETANEIQGDVSRICDAWKEVNLIVAHMKLFVEPLKTLVRKEAAQQIISSYGTTNRASFCFTILDGKELSQDQLKKILWQSLKK